MSIDKIDIQLATDTVTGFDLLVNGDHYMRYGHYEEAISAARNMRGLDPYNTVIIRDYTGERMKVIE